MSSTASPMELSVDLGPMPKDDRSGGIIGGLRSLFDRSELCDVIIIAGGQSFMAHKAVLAAVSTSFHDCLTQVGAGEAGGARPAPGDSKSLVLKLDDVKHAEAVQAMLDCIYANPAGAPREYDPSSDDVNRDVLRLAQRFNILQLQDQSSRWLLRGLSTANVLERLVACEEFALAEVRDQILHQLTSNPDALFVLANDPEIVKVPTVLQDLLLRILKLLGVEAGNKAAVGVTPVLATAAQATTVVGRPAGGGKASRKAGA